MEECICVLDALRVLGKGQSHNNGIFLHNLTQPLIGPQLGYYEKKGNRFFFLAPKGAPYLNVLARVYN